MLKHIVFFRIKDNLNESKEVIIQVFKDKLDNLKKKIPVVKELETGVNISNSAAAFDLSLTVLVEDEKALDIYRNHPEHQKLLDYLNEIKQEVAVVDYII